MLRFITTGGSCVKVFFKIFFEENFEMFSINIACKYPYLEFFWSLFSRIRTEYGEPAFGLNTATYSVSLRTQSECGKIGTRKTPNTNIFTQCNPFKIVFHIISVLTVELLQHLLYPVDPGCKLIVHKTFRRRPGRLLNVLCTFNLRPVSTG